MTNNTTEEEEFYPGFPTRWLLALSVALTGLFVFIDYRLYGLGKILAIQLISHGLTALACGWLTNRLKLWRNWRDILFFVVMGCPLHKFIDTAIDGLMHREFLQTLKFALQWWLDYPFSLSHWLPDRATLGTMLAGIFLLPAVEDWQEDDYPELSSFALCLPMAVLPELLLIVFCYILAISFPPYRLLTSSTIKFILLNTPIIVGAGVVAAFYLRWMAKRLRLFRRYDHIVLFLLLGLLSGFLIESLVSLSGALVVNSLEGSDPGKSIEVTIIFLFFFNMPGLAIGLLVGCSQLPPAPKR